MENVIYPRSELGSEVKCLRKMTKSFNSQIFCQYFYVCRNSNTRLKINSKSMQGLVATIKLRASCLLNILSSCEASS